jgi:hypothetical protein
MVPLEMLVNVIDSILMRKADQYAVRREVGKHSS